MSSDSPRRGGRPPLVAGDQTTPLTARVPNRDFDRACLVARQQRVSLADLVRRALRRVLDDEEGE